MDSATLQIVIGGEAGQGLVTLGDILARSLVRSGYHIHLTPNYMSRIHGGHNTVAIRVGLAPVVAPQEPINILVALDAETVQLHRGEMVPGNSTVILDDDAADDVEPCVRVPFKKSARLIRKETGFEVDRLLLRYDGLPLTPEYIMERLNPDEKRLSEHKVC